MTHRLSVCARQEAVERPPLRLPLPLGSVAREVIPAPCFLQIHALTLRDGPHNELPGLTGARGRRGPPEAL